MFSLFLLAPVPLIQTTIVPLPELEAKDLALAPRGPMTPQVPDAGLAGAGIMGRIRHEAREAPSVPALQLPAGSVRVVDKIPDVSGWRAYAIEVPAGGKVKVQVVEGRKGWFRVLGVNAWGREEPGLLQNRIATGEPRATYENPGQENRTIYFLVDTLDWNMVGDPYTIEVIRS